MIRLAFWNLYGNASLTGLVAELARGLSVDVLILAECELRAEEILPLLNPSPGEALYYRANDTNRRLHTYFCFSPDRVRLLLQESHGHWSIFSLTLSDGIPLLIVGIHLRSKLYVGESDQYLSARQLGQAIRFAEQEVSTDRVIVIGDLNMDPFELPVIAADGLHAVSSRRIAERRTRRVINDEYPFFYNPMWNLLGDQATPPGTYFFDHSGHVACSYWHLFDQVLIRPSLVSV